MSDYFLQMVCPDDQPIKCAPTGTCCSKTEFCNSKGSACLPCFPSGLDDQETLDWCRTVGIRNLSAFPNILCTESCYVRFPLSQLMDVGIGGSASNTSTSSYTSTDPDHQDWFAPFCVAIVVAVSLLAWIVYFKRDRIKPLFNSLTMDKPPGPDVEAQNEPMLNSEDGKVQDGSAAGQGREADQAVDGENGGTEDTQIEAPDQRATPCETEDTQVKAPYQSAKPCSAGVPNQREHRVEGQTVHLPPQPNDFADKTTICCSGSGA